MPVLLEYPSKNSLSRDISNSGSSVNARNHLSEYPENFEINNSIEMDLYALARKNIA